MSPVLVCSNARPGNVIYCICKQLDTSGEGKQHPLSTSLPVSTVII